MHIADVWPTVEKRGNQPNENASAAQARKINMKEKAFYKKGGYYKADERDIDQYIRGRRIKRLKGVLLIALCLIGLLLFLKCTVYTEQYHWSNELVWAIQRQDEAAVKKLLRSDHMDVNRPGGVEFPAYIIGLDECARSIPLEEACWGHNYKIAKMLIEHGADADQEIQEELPLMVWVAGWLPEEQAELNDLEQSAVENDMTAIYKLLLKYSNSNEKIQLLKKSLTAASDAENQTLVNFLKSELERALE